MTITIGLCEAILLLIVIAGNWKIFSETMLDGSTSPVGLVIWVFGAAGFNVFMGLIYISCLHFGWA